MITSEAEARKAIYKRLPAETKISTQLLIDVIEIIGAYADELESTDRSELALKVHRAEWELEQKATRMLKRCCYGYTINNLRKGTAAHDLISAILAAEDLNSISSAIDDIAFYAAGNDKI